VWTPDGQRVVFQIIKGGRRGLAWVRADGGGAPAMLASGNLAPSTWSPSGTELLGFGDRPDLWAGTLRGSTLDVRWLPAEGFQGYPALSPDGQYLAYVEQFGSYSVFVRPYPSPGARLSVSVTGPGDAPLVGRDPVWNRNGREIFYVGWLGDWSPHIMVAPVERTPTLAVGRARELFEFKGLEFGDAADRSWDVAPDGQRFYFISRVPPKPGSTSEPPVTHIRLVQNWLEELKAKVPTGR
jgi:Tol biopolymer transport system component